MVGVTKVRTKPHSVYFGHPSQFWKDRQRYILEGNVNIEELKKLSDVVEYDSVHLQKAIINRVSDKVNKLFNRENQVLEERRLKLKALLETDEECYIEELVTKQELTECEVCKRRENKIKEYHENIEREKIIECQRALEREKIAKGMQCKRSDNVQLKEMQKIQIEERRYMNLMEQERDKMWHQVLIDDVRRKEQMEQLDFNKRQQEMVERRMVYDEQIASATKRRNEALRQEREKENRRIEEIKKRLEHEHAEATRRKKEQQMFNENCYKTGHLNKLSRHENEKWQARILDNETIQLDLKAMEKEKQRQMLTMRKLQMEKELFVDNQNREREMCSLLENESEKAAEELRLKQKEITVERERNMEAEMKRQRELLAENYNKYLHERKLQLDNEKKNREVTMERVRRKAVAELHRQFVDANEEFKKQLEYRNSLNYQIEDNQRKTYEEQQNIDRKQNVFTNKMINFKDAMQTYIDKSPGRKSTNPIHPFAKVLQTSTSKENTCGVHFPVL